VSTADTLCWVPLNPTELELGKFKFPSDDIRAVAVPIRDFGKAINMTFKEAPLYINHPYLGPIAKEILQAP
jgi:hypothetical protein